MANRLLESDEDLDSIELNLGRYTQDSGIPGVHLEREGVHWNVYRESLGLVGGLVRRNLGEIYYVDGSENTDLSPDTVLYYKNHPWLTVPNTAYKSGRCLDSFSAALKHIVDATSDKRISTESLEDDMDVSAEIKHLTAVPTLHFTSTYTYGVAPRPWKVELSFDRGTHHNFCRPATKRPAPSVRFIDMTNAGTDAFPDGQFVSSYYAATLVERPAGYSMSLNDNEPLWKIDATSVEKVKAWIKDEVEVKRGYKLNADGFMSTYESMDDPDAPDLYLKPPLDNKQPVGERLESTLRIALLKHYDDVRIIRELDTTGLSMKLKEPWLWTVHCNRAKALPLRTWVGNQKIDWWDVVKDWIHEWANNNGQGFIKSSFKHYGRLRFDPTFTFKTFQFSFHLRECNRLSQESIEDDDSPEHVLKDMVGKIDWAHEQLVPALWKFHPQGVLYNALGSASTAIVTVSLYFPPDENNYAARLRDFIKNWLEANKIMPVNEIHLYSATDTSNKTYTCWSLFVIVNSKWTPGWPEHLPAVPETGQAGTVP